MIPILIIICTIVISTVGPQRGPKWRNLFKKISRLRFVEFTLSEAEWARNDRGKASLMGRLCAGMTQGVGQFELVRSFQAQVLGFDYVAFELRGL